MTSSGSILWVIANPDPGSLSHSLYRHGVEHLRDTGHSVADVDLYATNWNPVLSEADTIGSSGETFSDRQRHATLQATLPADVARQQQLVAESDTVIIQFPLWWYGMPAILKGWFDRVFTNGFAFGVRDQDGKVRKYGDGGLAGRRLLPIVTAGDRADALGPRGISGDIDDILWPLLHGTAHYTGMLPLRPHLISSANHVDAATYRNCADALTSRLDAVSTEPPIRYRSLRGGDYTATHDLRPHVRPGERGLAIHCLDSPANPAAVQQVR
ncbi:NAD(P)H-dependent oxidoreductase [Nocardia sp. XZ_19_385]|uniref:NAD(P)H-dependent oxidoreductase n=1 Tax=Nocardia sp. XZ_19_385 TaxID=2769488 RepID=UPI00188F68BA|nr:NAD(P)H-dependent oxidoreductase [Nocardia sp. XZ_19_385]